MTLVKTFIDGNWNGYQPMKEVVRLRTEFNRLALEQQKVTPADHRVFAHYDLHDGEVETAWFYSNQTFTDSEFDRIGSLTNCQVWALHARR